jgi:peptidoglycan-N-acetylglucosamine deacetylase
MRLFKIPSFISGTHRNFTWELPGNGKSIYLTFDDGPTIETTGWLLDILANFNAKATFFCVGNNVRKLPGLYKRMVDEGHSLGNHTQNHCKGLKMGISQYISDVDQASEYINSRMFRPPYGKMRGRQARGLIKKGYRIIMWNVLSYDFDRKLLPETVLEKSIKLTKSGTIIVFHDNVRSFDTLRKVLPAYLEYFSGEGYEFRGIE